MKPNQLRAIAPGVVWVTALLASLLALPRLFEHDLRDGTLEQLLLSPEPAVVWVLAKVAVHWLVTGVPVALFAPLLQNAGHRIAVVASIAAARDAIERQHPATVIMDLDANLDESLNFVKLSLPDGKDYTLPQAVSASGARYTDDHEVVWWNKGKEGFVEMRDEAGEWQSRYNDCKEQ